MSFLIPEGLRRRYHSLERRDPKHTGTHIRPDTEVLDRKSEKIVSRFLANVNSETAAQIIQLMGADPYHWRAEEGASPAAVIEAVSRATERGGINRNIVGLSREFVSKQVSAQLQLYKTRQLLIGTGSAADALSINQHLIGADDTDSGKISRRDIMAADKAFVGHDVQMSSQNDATLYQRAVFVYMTEVLLGGSQPPEAITRLDSAQQILFMAQMVRRSFERALWEGTIDEKVAFAQANLLKQKGINPDNYLDSPGSYGMMTVFLANPFHGFRTQTFGKLPLQMMNVTRGIGELAYNRAVAMQLFPAGESALTESLLQTLKYYLEHGAFRAATKEEAEAARAHIAKVEKHITDIMLGTAGKLIDYATNTADQMRQPLALAKQVEKYSPRETKVVTTGWANAIAKNLVEGTKDPKLVILDNNPNPTAKP